MKVKNISTIVAVLIVVGITAVLSVGATYIILSNQNSQASTNTISNSKESTNSESTIPFEQDLSQVGDTDLQNHAEDLTIDNTSALTAAEIEDLVYMREEEKLARDVYTTLYNKWQLNIFQNISESEQTHTDSIKTLLENYSIDDPYIDQVGLFTNETLSKLYTDLITQGSISITEALKVGALIEDLDIVDLENAKKDTSNTAILSVYDNLQRGSRNHIRSFTQTLSRYGESYTPSYLSQAEYLEIISGGRESGSGNGNGNGKSN